MTTHDDLTDLETRLRSSLRERADDVDTTPALYERVQRQASRGAWLRRGLALAGAAAVVAAAFAVVPPLLPEPDLDIANTPEDAAPTDGPTPEEDTSPSILVPGTGMADPFLEQGLVFAEDSDGGSRVKYGDGSSSAGTTSRVVTMAAAPVAASPRELVMGLADGTIAAAGPGVTFLPEASANGGGVTFSPDGQAIAWIDGSDLHIAPTGDLGNERVLPLVGDVPIDLRIEQWFRAVDAPIILASEPGGGVWSIPMDESDVFNTAPTEEAFVSAPDALDSVLLPDLRRIDLVRDSEQGLILAEDGELRSIPAGDVGDDLELTANADGTIVLHDPTTGTGHMLPTVEGALGPVMFSWQEPSISAVAPRPGAGVTTGEEGAEDQEPAAGDGDPAALGLSTDAPVVGTSGRFLVAVTAPEEGPVTESDTTSFEVYPAESEATLGRLAVRPGSTLDDGLIAVESSSEGETSVRFVALRGGGAAPVGEVLVTDGPVSGLVWTEDGSTVIWSDAAGIRAAGVAGEGDVAGLTGEVISDDTRPVLDAVWTEIDRDGDFVTTASGHLTVAVDGGTGVELLGLEREGDTTLRVTGPAGGADRVILDTHTSPDAIGPEVHAAFGGATATLRWIADDDRSGDLPDPGQVGGDVRVQASGGQVLVMGVSRKDDDAVCD